MLLQVCIFANSFFKRKTKLLASVTCTKKRDISEIKFFVFFKYKIGDSSNSKKSSTKHVQSVCQVSGI